MNWTDKDHDYNPEIEQMIEDRLFSSEQEADNAILIKWERLEKEGEL
jgi:hypothetical protein